MDEEFRRIDRFPQYTVSNWGRIKRKGKPVRPFSTKQGYQQVCLSSGNAKKYQYVHRLVLEAFVGACPEGLQTRHLDNDPRNNRLDNLCWGSSKENGEDKVLSGSLKGEKNPRARMTKEQVLLARKMKEEGATVQSIVNLLGLPYMPIYNAVTGKSWKHLP